MKSFDQFKENIDDLRSTALQNAKEKQAEREAEKKRLEAEKKERDQEEKDDKMDRDDIKNDIVYKLKKRYNIDIE